MKKIFTDKNFKILIESGLSVLNQKEDTMEELDISELSQTDDIPFNYELIGDLIYLNRYTGSSDHVVVYPRYTVDGKRYGTRIGNSSFYVGGGCWLSCSPLVFDGADEGFTSIEFMDGVCINGAGYDTGGLFGSEYGTYQLTSITFGLVDTNELSSMSNMFVNTGIASIDLSNFNTGNVVSMKEMFSGCHYLTDIEFGDNFDTSNTDNMCRMFNCCISMPSLDVAMFDTSKVTSMLQMFDSCKSLTTLDLTSFDTHNVTSMRSMFADCPNLTEILVSRDKWVISDDCDTDGMFENCGVDHVTYVD